MRFVRLLLIFFKPGLPYPFANLALFLARVRFHIIMTQVIPDQDKCSWSRRIDSNYRGHYINGFTDRLLQPSRTRLDIFYMAGDEGYAPSLQVSKTYVLLLYESPIIIIVYKISAKLPRYKVLKLYYKNLQKV